MQPPPTITIGAANTKRAQTLCRVGDNVRAAEEVSVPTRSCTGLHFMGRLILRLNLRLSTLKPSTHHHAHGQRPRASLLVKLSNLSLGLLQPCTVTGLLGRRIPRVGTVPQEMAALSLCCLHLPLQWSMSVRKRCVRMKTDNWQVNGHLLSFAPQQ